jgi:ParB family chromosome partitioning protein
VDTGSRVAVGADPLTPAGRVFNGFFLLFPKGGNSMATIYEIGKIYMIPPAEILQDPGQPRKHMDPVRIQELATTAKRVGIVQPITCRQDPVTYLIYNVAGSRRLAAARLAGLTEVPVIFVKNENSDEVAIVENVQRQDLNPVEEAEAFQRFMDEHKYPQDQLADIIGKDQSTVSRTLSLNRTDNPVLRRLGQ